VTSVVSPPTTRKTVLVLGRSSSGLSVPSLTEADEAIVVLAIGWPVSDEQRSVLDAAEARARADGVPFDAHLLAGPDAVRGLVGGTDRIFVDAGPRETRRIRRALGRRP
jgi:hypothetical protein